MIDFVFFVRAENRRVGLELRTSQLSLSYTPIALLDDKTGSSTPTSTPHSHNHNHNYQQQQQFNQQHGDEAAHPTPSQPASSLLSWGAYISTPFKQMADMVFDSDGTTVTTQSPTTTGFSNPLSTLSSYLPSLTPSHTSIQYVSSFITTPFAGGDEAGTKNIVFFTYLSSLFTPPQTTAQSPYRHFTWVTNNKFIHIVKKWIGVETEDDRNGGFGRVWNAISTTLTAPFSSSSQSPHSSSSWIPSFGLSRGDSNTNQDSAWWWWFGQGDSTNAGGRWWGKLPFAN